MSQSKVKQNFHSDSEALINKQINMELYASYVYLSMVMLYFLKGSFMILILFSQLTLHGMMLLSMAFPRDSVLQARRKESTLRP